MAELDLLDRKLMYELDINARIPVTQLAKKVRASKETVNFRLKRLLEEEYIKGFYTLTNTSKLGYFYYKTFIKLHGASPSIEKQIIEFVKSYPTCAYLASIEGHYDLITLNLVNNQSEIKDFMNALKHEFGRYILEKEVHTVLSTHRMNQKLLYSGKTANHVYYQDQIETYKTDKIDYGILRLLSSNARMSLADIGKELNVDPKVVRYRIKKLERNKIIIGYASAPHFEKLGFYFIQLNFSLQTNDAIPAIISFFDKTKKCTFALKLLGQYDLTIEIHVENDADLRDIMGQFKEKFSEEIMSLDISRIFKEHRIVWMPLK
jgi:DNA-binding Lrp family transcriptional regulator